MDETEKLSYQMQGLKDQLKTEVAALRDYHGHLDNTTKRFIAHLDVWEDSARLIAPELQAKLEASLLEARAEQTRLIEKTLERQSSACLQQLKQEAEQTINKLRNLRIVTGWRQLLLAGSFSLGCVLTAFAVIYFMPHKHQHYYNIDTKLINQAKTGQLLLQAMQKMPESERKKYKQLLVKEMANTG